MKIKKLLGIFFFLALINTTVFGFSAENSRQGSNQNFTNPHQGFTLSKAAPAPGRKISIHYFESSSGKVFDVAVKSGWSNF